MEEITKYFPDLTEKQLNQFERLKGLYEHWNAQINVISRKDMDEFYNRHVLHSLAIAKLVSFSPDTKLLDIGTGGGFPSIPLAILFPKVKITAVDSIGKKIKVVKAVAQELELRNIHAIHLRVEQLEEKFDFILGRAVARSQKLVEWANGRMLKKERNSIKNGFLLLKGGDLKEELSEVKMFSKEYPIASIFKDEFFETKKVVYLTAKN